MQFEQYETSPLYGIYLTVDFIGFPMTSESLDAATVQKSDHFAR